MKVLITGGLGYLGAWATRELALAGHEVFVLSRRATRPDLNGPYALVQADLAMGANNLAALLPDGLEACIHAASFNEGFAPDYARRALEINGLGTRCLIDALLAKAGGDGAMAPLLVYLSTFHVYGKAGGIVDEDAPLEPRNDYALTHLVGEEYCRLAWRTKGLRQIIARPSNGYGAPVFMPCDKWYLLLNDLCRSAVKTGAITLNASPEDQRDFIWLGDVAKSLAGLAQRPDLSGEIFNLSFGASLSLGQVVDRVAEVYRREYGGELAVILKKTNAPGTGPLSVRNDKIRQALGLEFDDRLDKEIKALFKAATELA